MATPQIDLGTPIAKTYTSTGQLDTSSATPQSGSQFGDFLKQPVVNAIESSHAHETAAIQAAAGKISSLELMQAATNAELSLQEFKVLWDKLLAAYNDVTRGSM